MTLGWYELSCDGGHSITEFVIRYRKEVPDYYVSSYSFVYGVDPSARNHTIYNLVADTAYNFAIQALSAEFRPSNFSVERLINTLIAGKVSDNIIYPILIICKQKKKKKEGEKQANNKQTNNKTRQNKTKKELASP